MENIFDRVVYTKEDQLMVDLIATIPNLSAFIENGIKDMVTFVELSSIFLQFSTSALPFDGPYFPRGSEIINLNVKDGGFF
jgi:hypothetical protein